MIYKCNESGFTFCLDQCKSLSVINGNFKLDVYPSYYVVKDVKYIHLGLHDIDLSIANKADIFSSIRSILQDLRMDVSHLAPGNELFISSGIDSEIRRVTVGVDQVDISDIRLGAYTLTDVNGECIMLGDSGILDRFRYNRNHYQPHKASFRTLSLARLWSLLYEY